MPGSSPSSWELSPEPGWLQTPVGAVFCWFHPPAEPSRDVAILLCDPLGSDRMNLHLAYRHLALALSRVGIPALRLDYPGTCDSEGSPSDKDRVSATLQALHAGADYLKERTGVNRLALFGARFGGTIALTFASQRDDVDMVCAWGVYTDGRKFVRNETAFDRLSNANPDQRRPTTWREGDVEAAGFRYTGQTVDDVRTLSLSNLPGIAKTEVLLIDWDSGEDNSEASVAVEAAGALVTSLDATDSGAASLHTQRVPTALIKSLEAWLLERSTVAERLTHVTKALAREVQIGLAEHVSITERCVRFGQDEGQFGILTLPSDWSVSSKPRAIVLVNGGNNHRVGINRNYTEWSRRWAQEGFAVLRIDIRGLGDSPPRVPSELNKLYLDRTAEDLTEAAAWLRKVEGVDELIFCGLCAGAYQILQFARKRSDISAVMLLELLRIYSWEPLQTPQPPLLARIRRYWAQFHPMWLVDKNRLGKWMLNLCASGTKCLVVYREDERMLTRFRDEMSGHEHAIEGTGNFQLGELGPSNHIISPLWAQEELAELLTAYLRQLKD